MKYQLFKNNSYDKKDQFAVIEFYHGVELSDVPQLQKWIKKNDYKIVEYLDREVFEHMSYGEVFDYASSMGFNGIGCKKEELIDAIEKIYERACTYDD